MNYKRKNGQPAIRLNTVNVVEITNGDLQAVRSFSDNPEGNKRAERLFKRLVREHEAGDPVDTRSDKEDFENFLDDGSYEDNSGYQLLLTHSV